MAFVYDQLINVDEEGVIPGARIGTASALTEYQHGPPVTAPTGFAPYNAGRRRTRRFVWEEMDALTYQSRSTADPTDYDEWTEWEEMLRR